MPGELVLGHLRKAYLDPEGAGEGTYAEIGKAGDVKLPLQRNRIELPTRGEATVLEALGLFKAEVSIMLDVRPGDDNFDALHAAFLSGDPVGFCFCTAALDTVGALAWEADMAVAQFPYDGTVEEARIEVILVPHADGAQKPRFFTVEAEGGGG